MTLFKDSLTSLHITDLSFRIVDLNECFELLEPCEYGGQCINTIGGYECICPEGRTGDRCEKGKDAYEKRCRIPLGSHEDAYIVGVLKRNGASTVDSHTRNGVYIKGTNEERCVYCSGTCTYDDRFVYCRGTFEELCIHCQETYEYNGLYTCTVRVLMRNSIMYERGKKPQTKFLKLLRNLLQTNAMLSSFKILIILFRVTDLTMSI